MYTFWLDGQKLYPDSLYIPYNIVTLHVALSALGDSIGRTSASSADSRGADSQTGGSYRRLFKMALVDLNQAR